VTRSPSEEGATGAEAARVHVKICGVTSVKDAEACVLAGASAIGVNLVPTTQRCVDAATARRIADAVGKEALVVAVVRDLSVAAMVALRNETGCGCLQLHGSESPESLAPLLPHAYKAIAVATSDDVASADRYGGEYVLLDAKTPAGSGGMGTVFDWSLATKLARTRKVVLAGGLTPENVEEAVRVVAPHTVDVASGVEATGRPREKDLGRVREFVAAVKRLGKPR
jgi:phosphoribosylanthranilate isomerase